MGISLDLLGQILEQLKSILNEQLADEATRIYLFGSWTRREEKRSSDIDVEASSPISSTTWNNVIEHIEESTIPYRVDVVDLNGANEQLIQ
ncbi:nucleotidyltransferase family protein [Sinobaca sp. H24]|uniref:nucleotidyltransferase family protein n=1 Tax=Sinobaca sp. H24 TaxID=2923376 RepID=UPI002079D1A0|nr:nucleotidyltransferase domain-containing protein [Sinobaca sp. H24]